MRIIYIFLAILILVSCSSNTDSKNVDLREYFWQIKDYSEPKVIVYDYDSMGVHRMNYYLVEQISSDKLALTRFDKNYNKTQYIVDRFTEKGVELDELSFVEDISSEKMTKIQIHEGLIFPYDDFDSPFSATTSFNLQSDQSIKITNKDFNRFVQITDKNINGITKKTIIAKGKTTRTIENGVTGQSDSYQVKMEVWYSKGIGITMMKQEYPNGFYYQDTFIEFISLDEFNNLRESKL